jgi:hypothetical protein
LRGQHKFLHHSIKIKELENTNEKKERKIKPRTPHEKSDESPKAI